MHLCPLSRSLPLGLCPRPAPSFHFSVFPFLNEFVHSLKVIICNHSGERYWYAWDDATEQAWKTGPGHTMVPPLEPGEDGQLISDTAR